VLLRIVSIASGAVAGFVAMALLDPEQRSTHLDIWAIAGGALLGALVYEALAPRR
jgi:hypothetical protein